MATAARRLSTIFLVAVLVATSCFADERRFGIPGKVARPTFLTLEPGNAVRIITRLNRNSVVNVVCRKRYKGLMVGDDPWWLHVTVDGLASIPIGGWVADFDIFCGGGFGNCEVPSCVL